MTARIAAAAALAMAAFAPAMAQAQTAPVSGPYVNLGYAHADTGTPNFEVLGARLGYRFNRMLGVEGEAGWGLKGYDVNVAPGSDVHLKLSHQYAAYGVGFLPLSENTDLFARVGYGTTKIKGSFLGTSVADDGESINFGVGAQHHFDGVNGVRFDYTRQEFRKGDGHANVWGVAYVRRF
jgi:outer membrane immunogenic protein